MGIFLKVALISYILAFVFRGILKVQVNNMNPLDALTKNYSPGMYVTALLFCLSVISGVVFSILTIVYWK